MSLDKAFYVKQGDEVYIFGMKYIALKPHAIVGIDLFEGTFKILSNGKTKDYTYEELSNSGLVSITTEDET